MILVDVEVPFLQKVYDMQVDEYTAIAILLEDMAGMICQKEQLTLSGDVSDLVLIIKRTQQMMDSHKTLKDYNVCSGQTLTLV